MRFYLYVCAMVVGALCAAPYLHAGIPVPVDFPGANLSGPVLPVIPVAKALVLPITAYDPDGHRLSFAASSDNPAILVRVRSGDPLLVFHVNHDGDPNASAPPDPAYSGDLVFQLFRHLAPNTVGYIAGFAQSGYYNNLIFHRLADLNGQHDASIPTSFIYQGGDPNGNGTGGPSFAFDNEFTAELIFAGRGQLAMANAGSDANYHGTNGSQFFITDGQITLKSGSGAIAMDGRPRYLDFGYTIFGQLTHGWPMLANLQGTPRWPTVDSPPVGQTPDLPKVPVVIESAGVVDLYRPSANDTLAYTDAVLVLSATAPGQAAITVTVSDDETPPKTVTQSFAAEALVDTTNDKPFLVPLRNYAVPKNTQLNIPFKVVDLERDYVTLQSSLSNSATDSIFIEPIGFSGIIAPGVAAVIGNAQYTPATGGKGYVGPLDLLLSGTQFDMTYRGSIDGSPRAIDSYAPSTIAVGDKPITMTPVVVQGAPGQTLTGVTVAKFQSANTRAQASDVVALINWGDGSVTPTVTSSGNSMTANFPADSIVGDPPAAARFQILGSHNYANPGTYPVTVSLRDSTAGGHVDNGLDLEVTSTAIISAGPLAAQGRDLAIDGRFTGDVKVAAFTDSGKPGAYTASIDWGDGIATPGSIRASAAGLYSVAGSHTYLDAEKFGILVHIHKEGDSDPTHDAVAWSSAEVTGFDGRQHLPPFDQAHLIAQLIPAPKYPQNPNLGSKPTKLTVPVDAHGDHQTYLTYALVVLNAGNKTSQPGAIHLYLSEDTKLNRKPVLNPDNTVAAAADILLKIGETQTEEAIPSLAPGEAKEYYFDISPLGDSRLRPPLNETASGYNIIADLEYSDPIANNEDIERQTIVGKIDGILVTKTVHCAQVPITNIQTDQAGTPAVFNVRLDKPPGKDLNGNDVTVTIPVTSSDTSIGTVSPASLTFTNTHTNLAQRAQDWDTLQVVTVTGATGIPVTGNQSFTIDLGPAVSQGGILDEMVGPTVNAVSTSIASNIRTSRSSIVTTDPNGPLNTNIFEVILSRQPTAPVTIQLQSNPYYPVVGYSGVGSGAIEGLLSVVPATGPAPVPTESLTLTFNPPSTSDPAPSLIQTVTVTGQSDGATSGSVNYSISFDPAQSDDPEFNLVQPNSIFATNEHFHP